jgi:hypothetical protein
MQRSARQRRARAGRRASLRRSSLRSDCAVVLGFVARRRTHFARFALCVQTGGDKSVHEARCARGPRTLRSSPPQRRPPACPSAPLRSGLLYLRGRQNTVALAAGGARRGRFLGRRGAQGQGRRACALRRLTRRGCLNEMSAANGVSSAARPWTEHHSAVGAKRRPPQHEPPPGTARRDARAPGSGRQARAAAPGRKPTTNVRTSFLRRGWRKARWSN